MKIFLEKAKEQFGQNLPFVIYKKPNEVNIIGLFQKNDTLFSVNDFAEKGFVFASFDGSQIVFIPENKSEIVNAICNDNKFEFKEKTADFPNELDKNNFENLVSKGIQAIKNNEFKKVVLSRKESIDLVNFDFVDAFEKLIQLYSSTFVYCFFHPKVGIWLGATPEQLLKVKNNHFETIALAGTQKEEVSNEVIWHSKEKEEQQFVTDYIVEKLKKVASEVSISKPYSVKAGSIWHIKTDISGQLNSDSSLQEVVKLLHPTPAVCGLPKEKAKVFILENENYDRTFYTGFLGELNIEDQTDLFVNLRCMEIEDSQAHLFMGCGITKDSIPEKEWEESINKSATMKKVL
ncbi:MAG: chorismate-binding protein [Flavobacterium sp.]|uniref:chorismate-binding protein n=1 Tax=Flavobacterium sp. TaxID=239 RepID=UPI0026366392|nr:chorismate-binding protein [Flavobacterium sp.]MDD5151780.1 chorismate-binding protein [Flavobacterium sp.]